MPLMDAVDENRALARWSALLPRSPAQVGAVHETDAELLPLGNERLLALTVDSIEEEIRMGLYRSPFTAGRTAAVASLADLAAVGADPLGLLLAVALPENDSASIQEGVAAGVADACREAGTYVLGGDTNSADTLSVTCVAAGVVPASVALRRTGLKPGDLLWSSGGLGLGSALGAARWLDLPASVFQEEDYRPAIQLQRGQALRGIASACIDTSDGLVAALDQLARLNAVAIEVDRPLHELLDARVNAVREHLGLAAFPFLAGQHGEFELVFGVPSARVARLTRLAGEIGWAPLAIGRVQEGQGLTMGGRAIDGARIRNLLGALGGDVAAYLRALCSCAAE
jgi:thiamine-monophosphate kinase